MREHHPNCAAKNRDIAIQDGNCELCGEPMPNGEEVFRYHGYSGPCPKKPIPRNRQECDCDGYHTFDELYDHRITLYIALCKLYRDRWVAWIETAADEKCPDVWRSKRHSDGKLAFCGASYVLGIGIKPGKQITYHIPIERWDETDFAETLEKAPEYDGHTSDDVIERLSIL